MLSNSQIKYNFGGVLNSLVVLEEGPINEIRLIGLTDWGWVLLLSIVILVVWLLIVFQARSGGAHEFGLVLDSDNNGHNGDHDVGQKSSELIEAGTED